MTGAQIERARAKERGQAVVGDVLLRDDDYDEFEAMLHGLSVSRPLIKVRFTVSNTCKDEGM